MNKTGFAPLRGMAAALCLTLALTACSAPAPGQSGIAPSSPSSPASGEAGSGALSGGAEADIGETAAKAVALAGAGLTEEEAAGLTVSRETENGVPRYLVAFSHKGTDYLYTIDAADGRLLSSRRETPQTSAAPAGEIDEAAARAAALAHAGLTEDQVAGMEVERDYHHGRAEYEIEFWQGATEYDYTIDAADGRVLEYKKELHHSGPPAASSGAPAAAGDIGEAAAKAAALAHAGLTEGQVAGMEVERDYDDGRLEYEIEFWQGTTEYDYTISGADGTVLEYEKETHAAGPSVGDIGEAAAKVAALSHAGLTVSQVTGMKVERDYDDGRLEYEVEFWLGATEYEYTISGSDGAVLECKQERH